MTLGGYFKSRLFSDALACTTRGDESSEISGSSKHKVAEEKLTNSAICDVNNIKNRRKNRLAIDL